MFSATLLPAVETLARSVLRDPVRVWVGRRNTAAATVKQEIVYVGQESGKLTALRQMLRTGGLTPPILIFVSSKERAAELFRELVSEGVMVDAIHADRTRDQRERVVEGFRAGRIWALICTDLMARGVDFKGVDCVINYDVPKSAVSYIHRVGRSGRAGRRGAALTFFTEDDVDMLRTIANIVRESGGDVPQWMLQVRRPRRDQLKRLARTGKRRGHIDSEATTRAVSAKEDAKRRRLLQQQRKDEDEQAELDAAVVAKQKGNEAKSGVEDDGGGWQDASEW